jgi:hypothetical protein
MGKKKDHTGEATIRVQGRVKGSLRQKVNADLEKGEHMQDIIVKALSMLYASSHSY